MDCPNFGGAYNTWDKETGKITVVDGTQDDGPDRVLRVRGKFLGIDFGTDITQLDGKIDNLDNSKSGVDDDGNSYTFQTYTVSNQDDADKLYNLYVHNTDREIARDKMTVDGEMHYRFNTSGHYESVYGDLAYYREMINSGCNVNMIEMEHNHGNPPTLPSGHRGATSPSTGDKNHVIDARNLFNDSQKMIKFFINRYGTRHPYDDTGKL